MDVIDVKADQEDLTELVKVPEDQYFVLHPGEFVLGSTSERVEVPDDLVARIEGKSSLGRLGLLIHSTAGFVDAGFDGHLTLELANVANLPIRLYPRHEDRPGQLLPDDHAGRLPLRVEEGRLEVPGPARPHPVALLRKLQRQEVAPQRPRRVEAGRGRARER